MPSNYDAIHNVRGGAGRNQNTHILTWKEGHCQYFCFSFGFLKASYREHTYLWSHKMKSEGRGQGDDKNFFFVKVGL